MVGGCRGLKSLHHRRLCFVGALLVGGDNQLSGGDSLLPSSPFKDSSP
jgi:hypothetical protein